MKPLLIAAAVAALSTAAMAQQSTTTVTTTTPPAAEVQLREIKDDNRVIQPFNLTVDQLEDRNIVDASGEKIGEIDEVLENAAGQPVAVVVETGGFLGIGDRDVVLGLDQVRLDGDRLITTLSSDQLKNLPKWKD